MMVNVQRALWRGALVTGLSLLLLAVVAVVTTAPRVNGSVNDESVGPASGETWTPDAGAVYHFMATEVAPQIVVTVIKANPAAFDTSSAIVQVFDLSHIPLFITPTVKIINSGTTAVMTVTNFPLYGTGSEIKFVIGYIGSPDFGFVSYTTVITHQTYIPDVEVSSFDYSGTDPCNAIVADPLTDYSLAQDSPYRFFSLTVPTTSTVYLTSTGYTVSGQMQLRRPPASGCLPTQTLGILGTSVLPGTPNLLVPSVPPGNYLARFSADSITSATPFTFRWNYIESTGLLEPNNSLCGAIHVMSGTTYLAYPEDFYDYYSFDVPVTGSIQITLAGYLPGALGQYQLIRQGATCANYSQVIAPTAGAPGLVTLAASNQPPGRYFLGVLTTGGTTLTQTYSFRITTNAQTWTGQINTCSPVPAPPGGCAADKINGTLKVYWAGAAAATHVTVTLQSETALGTCPAGSSTFTSRFTPSTTPNGNWTKTGIAKGHYKLKLEISGPLGYTIRGYQAIKMDCNFLLNGTEPLSTPVLTDTIPLVPPTPIPPPMEAIKPDVTPAP